VSIMWLTGQVYAQDFPGASSPFPCQDGWMACEVEGQRLEPGLRRDEAGRVIPADARLGWFDLKPSASFSPFVTLTHYPAPEEPPKGKVTRRDPPPPPPPIVETECEDLTALEPLALVGKLDKSVVRCLETRLVRADKLTDKEKLSGVLMVDAWAKGDKQHWETLATRHLDEISQSDPDLCYKYALYLAKQGPARSEGVLRWAGVALENRTVWSGDTYKNRVYSLYKVRAAAAQTMWVAAEKQHAGTPSAKTREEADRLRSMTKVNAREWYEYALSAEKPADQALELCRSAAGTSEYCEVR
jgi:hypothetical protein